MAAKLYRGDCLTGLDLLPDACIDACIADPPYGTTACAWDSIINLDQLWPKLRRVVKPHGAIVLFSAQPFTSVLVMSNLAEFRYEWIWDKVNKYTGALNANRMPMRRHENVVVFYRKQPTYNKQFREGKPYKVQRTKGHGAHVGDAFASQVRIGVNHGQHNPCTILEIPADRKKELGLHPTQKVEEVVQYFVRTYTNPGETVLDFAMGSGTTGAVCLPEGRNFVGMEKDESIFEGALHRIKAVRERLDRSPTQ